MWGLKHQAPHLKSNLALSKSSAPRPGAGGRSFHRHNPMAGGFFWGEFGVWGVLGGSFGWEFWGALGELWGSALSSRGSKTGSEGLRSQGFLGASVGEGSET